MYHLTAPGVLGTGTGPLDREGWLILDQLASGVLSGHQAEHVVIRYMKQLTLEDSILFGHILNKDLRCGISTKTINSVWPGLIPTHDVMLAHKFDEKRVTFPCWATLKIDGIRSIYRDGEFYTRNGKKLYGLTRLKEHLVSINAPVLDLELYVPGVSFQVGSGMIRSYTEVPNVSAYILDLPESKESEYGLKRVLVADYTKEYIQEVPAWVVRSIEELQFYYQRAIEQTYEGLVVRPLHYTYEHKRSYSWMKMKQVESEDLPVVGLFEGEGKYMCMLGGIIVNRNGVQVKVGGGFSDDERREIWDGGDKYTGWIAEVLYHEVTPDGSLRHPRFLRWRFDK